MCACTQLIGYIAFKIITGSTKLKSKAGIAQCNTNSSRLCPFPGRNGRLQRIILPRGGSLSKIALHRIFVTDIHPGGSNEVILYCLHADSDLSFRIAKPEPSQLRHNGQALPLLLCGQIHILHCQRGRIKTLHLVDGTENSGHRIGNTVLTHIATSHQNGM